ncbi:MAG: radical SAM protein [Candidatus Aenigmatarchaeota archaeon]
MTFKVLFVYPNFGTPISFSPAIQILSAVLKRAGYETALLHLHEKHGVPDDKETIINEVKKHNPDLIGFTSTSFEYDTANRIASWIKSAVAVPIVLGGTHATIMPSDLEASNFDAFHIGEGEENLLELVQKMSKGEDYTNVPSFYFKIRDVIKKNPLRPMVSDLNSLPLYDMEIMDTKKILLLRSKWMSVGFSRGCPYNCTFCINHLLRKIKSPDDPKAYLRKRSVENVISEFESIIKKYVKFIDVFNFDDDLLMLDKEWMMSFVREYKKRIFDKYGIEYAINARVNTMTDDLIGEMAKSGCREIRIGFETGDPKLREEILNKPITDEQLISAFGLCHKHGIRGSAFTMLGIPQESHESIRKSVELLARLKPYLIRLTFLYPYYHTTIHDYCREHDLFKGGKLKSDVFSESPLVFKDLTDAQLLKYKHLFAWHINKVMLPREQSNEYVEAIAFFDGMSYEEFLKASDAMLAMDEKLSEKMRALNLAHFRYFRRNLYYYQLWEPVMKFGGEEND